MGAQQSVLMLGDVSYSMIDPEVLEESVSDVLARMQSSIEQQPFEIWQPRGAPADNVSWIVFGFDKDRLEYPEGYYNYDMGMTDANRQRAVQMKEKVSKLLAELMPPETGVPAGNHDDPAETQRRPPEIRMSAQNLIALKAFQTTLVGMTAQECRFPAAPMVAHHVMLRGEFEFVEGWPVPIYIQNQSSYGLPCSDFLAGLEAKLVQAGLITVAAPTAPVMAVRQKLVSPAERNLRQVAGGGRVC